MSMYNMPKNSNCTKGVGQSEALAGSGRPLSDIVPKNFFAVVKALVQAYGTNTTKDSKHQYDEPERELQLA